MTMREYEQLYSFLDHERMGLARQLYSKDTYNRRAREARRLGLEVPCVAGGAVLSSPPDV